METDAAEKERPLLTWGQRGNWETTIQLDVCDGPMTSGTAVPAGAIWIQGAGAAAIWFSGLARKSADDRSGPSIWTAIPDVRFREQSGNLMLNLRFTAFDPKRISRWPIFAVTHNTALSKRCGRVWALA